MQAAAFAPSSLAELVEAMREAARRGDALAFTGGGTEQDYGYPPERVDATISTLRLDRIVDYAPGDMTVTVEAGMTLGALQAALRAHGQRLALDAPLAARATLGGLVATNGYGPLRARYGTPRDLILGASFVRADGTLARGGGKVVKNVAGFDLPRLLTGSLGTLGCTATATFRLHPLPEARAAVRLHCATAGILRAACAMLEERRLEPASVVALNVHGGIEAVVAFEGFAAGVAAQARACADGAAALGAGAELDVDDAAFAAAHERNRTEGEVRVKAAFPAAALERVYDAAFAPHARAFGDGAVALYPTLGIGFLSGPGEPADVVTRALPIARATLEALGGSLVLLAAPAAVREHVDVYGALPPSFAVMRELKARFDPDRRLNRGRFVGRL
jgi:glycolate oxidase FAD binding subunit